MVALTRSFGDPKVVRKTGIKVFTSSPSECHLFWLSTNDHSFVQHVAICPWFADTGILDGIDKTRLRKQVLTRMTLIMTMIALTIIMISMMVIMSSWLSWYWSWWCFCWAEAGLVDNYTTSIVRNFDAGEIWVCHSGNGWRGFWASGQGPEVRWLMVIDYDNHRWCWLSMSWWWWSSLSSLMLMTHDHDN